MRRGLSVTADGEVFRGSSVGTEGSLAAARSIVATQAESSRVASVQHIHAAAGM
jgi:hypothetical protein